VAKFDFQHSRLRKHLFIKKFDGKMSNFKMLGRPWTPPSDAHAPKTSYYKKTGEDNKNVFTNTHIMI